MTQKDPRHIFDEAVIRLGVKRGEISPEDAVVQLDEAQERARIREEKRRKAMEVVGG